MWKERQQQQRSSEAVLLFGSRTSMLDEEINEAVKCGALSNAWVAHSRPSTLKKSQYVEDLLVSGPAEYSVQRLFRKHGDLHIYLCGSGKMVDGVNEALLSLLQRGGWTQAHATAILADMRQQRRLRCDSFTN